MEESTQKDVYELVYDADRPELFFKSVAWRVVGDHDHVGIRADSTLDVPEPEFGVVINAHAEIIGYVVSNDMSSRSIEGENPLYLPQAKIYAGACALSSGIRPSWELDASALGISMSVTRDGSPVFIGSTSTSQLHRSAEDLVSYLFRGDRFPDGAVLSTGTGIVPDVTFTLQAGDEISIEIAGVGALRNTVTVGLDEIVRPEHSIATAGRHA
ncbi:UNVERIFIED_CONTAM: fumarylacetoacetate hydrolase family protein [Microbacterium sp. SLM126]